MDKKERVLSGAPGCLIRKVSASVLDTNRSWVCNSFSVSLQKDPLIVCNNAGRVQTCCATDSTTASDLLEAIERMRTYDFHLRRYHVANWTEVQQGPENDCQNVFAP